MATRATKASKDPQTATQTGGGSVFAFATGQTGSQLAPGELVVSRPSDPRTYMINPGALQCRNGRIVPKVAHAMWTAGLCGNGKTMGRGEGMRLQLQGLGYTEIPHDFPAVAFGAQRVPGPGVVSSYLDEHQARTSLGRAGRAVKHYTDCWTRPERLGHMVDWVKDHEGRDSFLSEALIQIGNKGRALTDTQIRIATTPILRKLGQLLSTDTAHSRRIFLQTVAHVPDEYLTNEFREAHRRIRGDAQAAS